MAPPAHIITLEATDLQDQVLHFFSRIIKFVAGFIAGSEDWITIWIVHIIQAVGDFFSRIWQPINFYKAVLDQLVSGLIKIGQYILEILLRACGILLTVFLWLLLWAAIALVSSVILFLVLDAAIKHLSREERTSRQTSLLSSNWQSTNYQTFAHGTRSGPPPPLTGLRWFNFNRTEANRPSTWSTGTQTSGPWAGHRHPSNPGYGTNRQTNDEAVRERQGPQYEAIQEEEQRLRKEEEQRREETRRKEEAVLEAARWKKLHAEALSRAFAAWIKRMTDMTARDLARRGRIPDPPGVPLQSGGCCREAKAGLGITFCKHSMGILVETYTMVNGIKREEFTRKLVRTLHPDNQKFVRSDARVREQAAEMTKILNGML